MMFFNASHLHASTLKIYALVGLDWTNGILVSHVLSMIQMEMDYPNNMLSSYKCFGRKCIEKSQLPPLQIQHSLYIMNLYSMKGQQNFPLKICFHQLVGLLVKREGARHVAMWVEQHWIITCLEWIHIIAPLIVLHENTFNMLAF